MNHLSGNTGKFFNLKGLLTLLKRARRWDLLFIDDHGKTISFQQVRGLFIAVMALILILAGTALFFRYLHKGAARKNGMLLDALALSQEEVKALQAENNSLMIKLAEAQSKAPKKLAKNRTKSQRLNPKSKKSFTVAPAKTEVSKQEKPPSARSVSPNKSSVEAGTTQPAAPPAAKKEGSPTVYDFLGYYNAQSETLTTRFIIKNIGPSGSNLSGYVFVITKGSQNDPETWVSVPSAKLVSGKPVQIKDGKYFKIKNFMPMKLVSDKITGPKVFNKSTVLIFSESGKLIFDKTYRVTMNVPAPPLPVVEPGTKTIPEAEQMQPSNSVQEKADAEENDIGVIPKETPPALPAEPENSDPINR